jgi:hypothetical protein
LGAYGYYEFMFTTLAIDSYKSDFIGVNVHCCGYKFFISRNPMLIPPLGRRIDSRQDVFVRG